MSKAPCCDWINRLTLPAKGGKEKKKGVKVKEERKVAPGATPPSPPPLTPPPLPPPLASLFSFDQDKNLGDCRAQIKGGRGVGVGGWEL